MTADQGPCGGSGCQHVSHKPAQIQTDLSVIFGAVVGAMLRAGVTADEVQLALASILKTCKAVGDRPGVLDSLADVIATTTLDVLEDWPGPTPER